MIRLSSLEHTWLIDLDGTVLKHNGYKIDLQDSLLPGALEFLHKIPEDDTIIFLTSRSKDLRDKTEEFLKSNGVAFRLIIYDLPYGERILINDKKPSGLETALALNLNRDYFDITDITLDTSL